MPRRAATAILTVGYEGRDPDELVDLLRRHDVEVLVDVRGAARSRRPGFAKTALSEGLAAAGIEYRHLPALGNPPENRDALRRGDPAARRRYLAHLDRPDGTAALASLLDTARTAQVALLCLERDHEHCHRTCLTDRLRDEHPDLGVVHL